MDYEGILNRAARSILDEDATRESIMQAYRVGYISADEMRYRLDGLDTHLFVGRIDGGSKLTKCGKEAVRNIRVTRVGENITCPDCNGDNVKGEAMMWAAERDGVPVQYMKMVR